MINRIVSQPYIYFAFCFLCGAIAWYCFGEIGALYGYGAGIVLAIAYLVYRLRNLS